MKPETTPDSVKTGGQLVDVDVVLHSWTSHAPASSGRELWSALTSTMHNRDAVSLPQRHVASAFTKFGRRGVIQDVAHDLI